MVKKVIWPLYAQKQFAKAYQFILQNSYQNAEKVKADILVSTGKLAFNPEIHPPDKYRKNNDEASELMNYIVTGLHTG